MTFERQISSLTMLCRYVYWLYDRFIMEDEHRASEVFISFTFVSDLRNGRRVIYLSLKMRIFLLKIDEGK